MEDVEVMCEKRRSSLKKVSVQLSRPVNVVTPDPAYQHHQYQGHERPNKTLMRNGSEGSLMKSGSMASTGDNLSLSGKLVRCRLCKFLNPNYLHTAMSAF